MSIYNQFLLSFFIIISSSIILSFSLLLSFIIISSPIFLSFKIEKSYLFNLETVCMEFYAANLYQVEHYYHEQNQAKHLRQYILENLQEGHM